MRQSTIAQRAFAQSMAELNEHMANGNFERAITICDYLSISHPGAVRVLRARAQALERLGDVTRALDDYKRVLEVVPTDHRAMTAAARCQQELADEDEARELAGQALDHDAANTAALALAGMAAGDTRDDVATARAMFDGGAQVRARKMVDRMITRATDRPDLKLVRADFLWRSGRRVEAIEACNTVLYEKADALPAHAILASIWRSAGATELATVHEAALARLDPDGVEMRDWFGNEDAPADFTPAGTAWAADEAGTDTVQTDAVVDAPQYLLDTAADDAEPVRRVPGPFDTADGLGADADAVPSAGHSSVTAVQTALSGENIDGDEDASDLPIDELDPEPMQQAAAERERQKPAHNAEEDEERAAWLDSLISSRGRAEETDLDSESPEDVAAGDVLPVRKLDWSPFRQRKHSPEQAADAKVTVPDGANPKQPAAVASDAQTVDANNAGASPATVADERVPEGTLTPALLDVVARSDDAVIPSNTVPAWIERIAERGASTPVDLKRAGWTNPPAQPPEPVIPPAPTRKKPAKRPPEAELQLARAALENGDLGTAEKHYRRLVKHAELLNDVSGDLATSQREGRTDRALQRVLGDAYMRLGDTESALAAYASILEKPAQQFRYKPMGAGRARKPRA